MAFDSGVMFLAKIGFMDVVLPFLFVFVVVLGLLERTQVFGKNTDGSKKNINMIVAFGVGFIFIASEANVLIMNTAMNYFVLITLIIICTLLMVGTFGIKTPFKDSKWVIPVLFIVLCGVFVLSMGLADSIDALIKIILHPAVILIVIFVLLIKYIIGSSDSIGDTSSKQSSSPSANKPTKEKAESPLPPQDKDKQVSNVDIVDTEK